MIIQLKLAPSPPHHLPLVLKLMLTQSSLEVYFWDLDLSFKGLERPQGLLYKQPRDSKIN